MNNQEFEILAAKAIAADQAAMVKLEAIEALYAACDVLEGLSVLFGKSDPVLAERIGVMVDELEQEFLNLSPELYA